IDSVGRVYLTGETNSANLPMPVTAFDPDYTPTVLRYYDAFLARFSPDGSALTYATYLGDAGVDIAHALTLGAENRVSLAGWTSSLHFPTTPGAFDTGYNDGGFFTDPYDAFVTTLQLPPPPAATYRIAGRILDTNGLTVANVRVDLVGEGIAVGCFATTDGNGTFALADLAAGAYTVSPRKGGFAFEPRSRAVSVPPNAIAQDFVMRSDQSAGLKPPLLVVHGFQGFSSKPITCTAVPEQFVGDPLRTTLDDLPSWFYADDEYDVYLARLASGPAYTASIDANALCLFQQIAALYDAAGRQPITIVAHSMGGLVSRTCLAYAGCREKVAALYTLGSPHGGLNYNFLLRLYLATNWEIAEQGICLLQSPLCQFATDQMAFFNLYTPNQDGIRYGFIAGDETPLFPGALIFPTDGPNDGVVSTNRALGYVPLLGTPFPADWLDSDPPVVQFVTDESHFGFF
ncbi:MAG: carboxypeptidase regulatory-like domain-containing protein, partial [Caldilineaceae bacterium]|nr:carboxypeptidase regulatory-like domain-containing protein [Caldilineaceae bacterium]